MEQVPSQNPIQQVQVAQPQSALPTNEQKKPTKSHKGIWFASGCCAIVLIALIVLAVVGYSRLANSEDLAQRLQDRLEGTPLESVADNILPHADEDSKDNTTTGNTVANTTPTNSTDLVSAVIATGVEERSGKASTVVNSFTPDQAAYYVVLEVRDLPSTDIKVEWLQGGEKIQEYTLPSIKGDKFVNFYLDVTESDEDARIGDYKVNIYFDGTLVKTLSFAVTSAT